MAQFGSFEHDRCLWQMQGVRKGAKQGVMRNGNEQNDYVLTVSHVVVRFDVVSLKPNIFSMKLSRCGSVW